MNMQKFKNKKIVIVGLGLIGGSIARAITQLNLCDNLWAVDRDESILKQAREAGVISASSSNLKEACEDADLIIFAVASLAIGPIFEELATFLDAGTLMTDVASVKCAIVQSAINAFGEMPPNYVPGHPIAGSEKSGFESSREDLFQAKKVILTPVENTSPESVSIITELWQALGAEILTMSVEHHDEVLAATSHLPHLLAYTLVDTLSQQGESEEIFRYAAGGFRDFTRIASSDPTMWRDIFVANADATMKILDAFSADLQAMRQALVDRDGDFFLTSFTRAKNSRDKFMDLNSNNSFIAGQSRAGQEKHNLEYQLEPGGVLRGEFRVPGDKSISHRAIILASIAEGTTTVDGFLEGEDSLATLRAFRNLGVDISEPEHGRLTIKGVGLHGLKPSSEPLYLGNSGTSMRLLTGLLAGQQFASTLTGDESLSRRPMGRVSEPLVEMGANIHLRDGAVAPVEITPASLKPIDYVMPVASAQVKSCLLLASLYVEGTTSITEPAPCRDHTERMLRGFSYAVKSEANRIEIEGGGSLKATHIDVPADISSAAFFMVGASISPGSDIVLKHVGINPTRLGVVNILRAMGADISYQQEYEVGGEPVADIRVRHSPLTGIEIPVDQVALAIDEFPAIFIAAACAQGRTVLCGAEELRVKESDRIQVMADGLAILGIEVELSPDGLIIQGGEIGGGLIDSRGDHRIAMSFVMASLRAHSGIRILDCNNVATSFPGFVEMANSAGLKISQTCLETP